MCLGFGRCCTERKGKHRCVSMGTTEWRYGGDGSRMDRTKPGGFPKVSRAQKPGPEQGFQRARRSSEGAVAMPERWESRFFSELFSKAAAGRRRS